MHVFVFVCVTPPTANSPNSISTHRVASWWKTQHTAAMEASKQSRSEIADFTDLKILGIRLKSSVSRGVLKYG